MKYQLKIHLEKFAYSPAIMIELIIFCVIKEKFPMKVIRNEFIILINTDKNV